MPFNGRLYDPERDAATTESDSLSLSSAAVLDEPQPHALTPRDLTAALAAEIDSPELAEMASLLMGQARALERHYPAAAVVPLPLAPRAAASLAPTNRRRIVLLGALTLASALALVDVGTWRLTAHTASHGAAPTAHIAPAGVVDSSLAVAGPSAAPQTARLGAVGSPPLAEEQRRLESVLEMDGSAREGLTDLEESGELPPAIFTF